MYAKAKRTFTTSSMPTQQSNWKRHNMEVSYVQSVWCIITVSWKFRTSEWFTGFASWSVAELHHLRCLMPAVQMSSQTVSCSICCTEHQPLSIVWLHELAVVFVVKTSRHFHVLVFFLACCELFWSASAAKHTYTTAKLILLLLKIV